MTAIAWRTPTSRAETLDWFDAPFRTAHSARDNEHSPGRDEGRRRCAPLPGDRLVLAAPHTSDATRDGEVVEARGPDGGPPYVVRWSDGHEGLFYPGPGALLRVGEHAQPEPPPAAPAPSAPEASAGEGSRPRPGLAHPGQHLRTR